MLDTGEIVSGILRGDPRSISRAVSIMETMPGSAERRKILEAIYPNTGNGQIIGITGPPGIGKSTMIGKLSLSIAQEGHRIGVVAVDASSPFSNGSILGNRLRMQDSLTSRNIFMRSLSTRGQRGGLSSTVWDTVTIMEASGMDKIIVETVGSGQADLDILGLADTIVLVLAPGLGDEIQAIKAGIMEIASIIVVNKIDREGAYMAMKDIQDMLAINSADGWVIPVIGTNALTGDGLEDLTGCMEKHWIYLHEHVNIRESRFRNTVAMDARIQLDQIVQRSFQRALQGMETILGKNGSPYDESNSIVKKTIESILKGG